MQRVAVIVLTLVFAIAAWVPVSLADHAYDDPRNRWEIPGGGTYYFRVEAHVNRENWGTAIEIAKAKTQSFAGNWFSFGDTDYREPPVNGSCPQKPPKDPHLIIICQTSGGDFGAKFITNWRNGVVILVNDVPHYDKNGAPLPPDHPFRIHGLIHELGHVLGFDHYNKCGLSVVMEKSCYDGESLYFLVTNFGSHDVEEIHVIYSTPYPKEKKKEKDEKKHRKHKGGGKKNNRK